MMKVRILRSTVADGRIVGVGEVVELDKSGGIFLVSIGKAEEFVEEVAPVEPVVEPDPEPEPAAAPTPARTTYQPRVKKCLLTQQMTGWPT